MFRAFCGQRKGFWTHSVILARGRFLIRSRRVLEDFRRFRNARSLWSTLFVSYYRVLRYARRCCLTECIWPFYSASPFAVNSSKSAYISVPQAWYAPTQRSVSTARQNVKKKIKLFSQYPRTPDEFTVKRRDVNSFSK